MSGVVQALGVFLPLAYFAAAFLYGMHFGGKDAPAVVRPRRIALALALVLHVALAVARWRQVGAFPVQDPWSTLSGIALGMAIFQAVGSVRLPRPGSGELGTVGVVLGTCGLLQALASAFAPPVPAASPEAGAPFMAFHVVTSLVAASALVLSGLHGWLYLVAYRRMRRHRFDPLVRGLPSLAHLSTMTRRAALAGFVLLTIGLNVGIAWAHYDRLATFHYGDPWVLAMLAIWIHFGFVAFSGAIPGLTARRASLAAALGLAVFLSAGALTLIPDVSFHWRP